MTHRFEEILIHALIAQWLEIFPVKGRFTGTWAAAEYDQLQGVYFGECRHDYN